MNKQISTKTAGIAIAVLVVILGFVVFIITKSANPPVTVSDAISSPASPAVKLNVKETRERDAKNGVQKTSKVANAEDSCMIIADRNIFKPIPTASVSENSQSHPDVRQRRPIPPMPVGMLPPMPGGSGFSGGFMRGFGGGRGDRGRNLAFTGIVDTPNGTFALIENTTTGETKFVAPGDTAFGMEVVDVSPQYVSLDSFGRTVDLAIGENKSNASTAPPTNGTSPASGNQPGQSAQPVQPPAENNALPFNPGIRRFGRRGMGRPMEQIPPQNR